MIQVVALLADLGAHGLHGLRRCASRPRPRAGR
jgi:hypothetical protein